MNTLKQYPTRQVKTGARTSSRTILTNKVLSSSYLLASMILLFGATTAAASLARDLPHPGLVISLAGSVGLMYLTHRLRNSELGLGVAFALAAFVGYALGPLMSSNLGVPDGAEVVMSAMAGSALIMLALSVQHLIGRTRFNFNASVITTGVLTGLLAGLGIAFELLPLVSQAISVTVTFLISGLFLAVTSNIIYRRETSYVKATITLVASVIDLLASPLKLLVPSASDRK